MSGIVSRISAITRKELRIFITDPQQLFFGLALPLITLALMVGAFSGTGVFSITGYALDLDRTPVSAELLRRLDQTPGITLRALTDKEATDRLNRSDIVNCVVIPHGFGEKLQSEGVAALEVRQRGAGGTEGQILNSYAAAIAQAMAAEIGQTRAVDAALLAIGLAPTSDAVETALRNVRQEVAASPVVEIETRKLGTSGGGAVLFFLPGIVTMFALFSIALNSQSLVAERKTGTLERLMTTRLGRGELLAGKFIAGMARTYLQILVLFAIGWAVFGIFSPATFALAMAFSVAVVAAGSALGVFIAAIANTPEQATWISVMASNLMAVIGGTFFAVQPGTFLARLSKLTVNYWAADGYRQLINRGAAAVQGPVLTNTLVLLGIAAVLMGIAVPVFRVRRD
jgi:ABC-2 type transport system permease protein